MDFSKNTPAQLIDETHRSNSWRMVMLLANAIAVGVQTDYMAVNQVPSVPKANFFAMKFFCAEVAVVVFFLLFLQNGKELFKKSDIVRFAGEISHVFPQIHLKIEETGNSSSIFWAGKGWDFWQVLRLMDMVFCIFFSLLAVIFIQNQRVLNVV